MREIKFRAWSKSNKVMEGYASYCSAYSYAEMFRWYDSASGRMRGVCEAAWFAYPRGELALDFVSDLSRSAEGDEVQLLQYTGLKDKNEKEIYEGDILGYRNKNIKSVVRFGEYNFGGGEYHESGIGFYLETYSYGKVEEMEDSTYWHPERTNEVIGNIYENPELIN